MDEATSALDNKTESNLIKAISNLNRNFTFIFIAHRISTIKECNCIYEFKMAKFQLLEYMMSC